MSSASTSVSDLLSMLREQRRRLPFEIGAFLALQATEELLERPRRSPSTSVYILEDGSIELRRAEECDESEALVVLHEVLAGLLAAAGEGVPGMLLDLIERPAASPDVSLERWRDELEASLIPLNRAAAKRVLARTLRDLKRGKESSKRAAPSGDSDDDLDALIAGRTPTSVEAPHTIAGPDSERPASFARPTRPEPNRSEAPRKSIFSDGHGEEDLTELREAPARNPLGLMVALTALALAVLGTIVHVTRRPHDSGASTPPRAPAAPSQPDAERGEIDLEVEPEGAVVRLFIGRAPTLADDVPVGVAQEFIALTDDGRAARFVVPAHGAYRDVDGVPELSVIIESPEGPSAAVLTTTDLRSETMGVPSGRVGRVRIDARLPNAKIYRTVGFAPIARVVGWAVDRPAEFVVSAALHEPQRVVVAPSDFVTDRGERRASMRVTLASPPAEQ